MKTAPVAFGDLEQLERHREPRGPRARAVAGASGGFLGLGSKISNAEAEVIGRLERAFPAGG